MANKLSEAQLWLVGYYRDISPFIAQETEYQFCADRKWRFDFALPLDKIAFEIEGGIYTHGAHVRGKHYESDLEKYNRATALGWKVYRFTPEQILKGQAKEFIERYL